MTLFCGQCGHSNQDDANFCDSCGVPLTHPGFREEPGPKTDPARGRRFAVIAIVLLLAAGGLVAALLVPSSPLPGMLAKLGIHLPASGSGSDTLYYVGRNGKWGYIDKSGTTVIPLQFDVPIEKISGGGTSYVFTMRNGPPYPVFQGGKWVLLDKRGERLGQMAFDQISAPRESSVVCGSKLGKWGCVDAQGSEVIPFIFERADPVEGKLVALVTGGLWGLADQKGNFVVQPAFRAIWSFADGLALVQFSDQKWGLINREGKEVSKKRFAGAGFPGEGLWPVKTADTWAIADLSGEIVQPLTGLKEVRQFKEGLAVARSIAGDVGYIDRSGKFVIPPRFGGGVEFQGGIAIVFKEPRWGVIGRDGQYLIPPVFFDINSFSDGVALARKAPGDMWLIDRAGRVIWPNEKRSLEPPTREFAKISASKWQEESTPTKRRSNSVFTFQFLQDKVLISQGNKNVGQLPFEPPEQGILHVKFQDGTVHNWELMSYGDELVFIDDQDKRASYLTRAGPAGGERKELAAGTKSSETSAKNDSSGSILGRLTSVFPGSGGPPSESDARSVFDNQRSKAIKSGLVVVNSFSKTNGQQMNYMGTEAYKVEFTADVTYPKGVMPECAVEQWPSSVYMQCLSARTQDVNPKKVGQTETITGEMVFEKTEKGWRGQDGKIY